MSTTDQIGKSVRTGASPADDSNSTPNVPNPAGRGYTKEAALSDREFQLLLEGAGEMEDYYGQQARLCILVMGRLGLRRAELGLDVYALKALFGWSDLATAQSYIASSGERTARSLHRVHAR